MYEYGQTWTLVGPDGTTLELNPASPNGLVLEEISGFDMPSVRVNVEALPEADGAVAGDFYFGARSVTLRGRVGVNVTAAERNQLVVNLQRVVRGLRGDVTLKSQSSGLPAMQVSARLEQPLRVSGGYLKEFLIALVCADPLIYSQTLNAVSASGVPAVIGAEFDWVFPIDFGGGGGATLSVSAPNDGNIETPPVLRVWEVTNPQIRNGTTGESIYVDSIALGSGEWIDIDVANRTAVRSDGLNVYSYIRFPDSTWWQLAPGSNTVEVFAATAGAGAAVDVTYRDAWI